MTHDHDHEHDHDQHEHQPYENIQLVDENGDEVEHEIVNAFEHEGIEYAVLYPVDGSSGEFALIFKVRDEGEEAIFESLTDEEFEKILPIYEGIANENE